MMPLESCCICAFVGLKRPLITCFQPEPTLNNTANLWTFIATKHLVFRVKQKSKQDSQITQFNRILNELNIDIIFGNSPQAKGRVERANRTLQNRLIKEIRLGRHQFDCQSECLATLLH
jgi:hypothetical protein